MLHARVRRIKTPPTASQAMARLSAPAEITRRLSGLKATDLGGAAWPASVSSTLPSSCRTRTLLSEPAAASLLPTG